MTSRRLLAVLLAPLLVALLATAPSPADAASRRHFRQAYTCGYVDSSHRLSLFARAGHWTDDDGNVVSNSDHEPCFSELLDTWHPTVDRFSATVRWYAGRRLLKTQRVSVRNDDGFDDDRPSGTVYLDEPAFGGIDCDSSSAPTLGGALVTARVTLHKSHYASRTVTTNFFDDYAACG